MLFEIFVMLFVTDNNLIKVKVLIIFRGQGSYYFDNVWHNGLWYKSYHLDLPTKLCRWLSDFLAGRVIQVKIEGSLSPKVHPKAGVPQDSNLSPLFFLIYVNDIPNPSHHQTNKSQFADDAGQ